MDIILASRSPRRLELLRRIVPAFIVEPSGVDEALIDEKDPLHFALAAAEAKARDVGEKHPGALVIAADTIVNLGSEILGKPETETRRGKYGAPVRRPPPRHHGRRSL